MFRHKCVRGGLILAFLALVAGCSVKESRHHVLISRVQEEAGDDVNSAKWVAKNCPFGMPKPLAGWDVGPSDVVYREGYVLQHSARDRISMWVCEGINNEQLTGPGDRDRSNWRDDPDLDDPKGYDADYKGSGYDRGHMAPAMNAKRTQNLMNQTHYMSNAVPQVGRKFNQSVWRILEERIKGWMEPTATVDDTELFIITGPLFWDEAEDDPDTADGLVEVYVIGDNEVAVPTHLYKIVVQNVAGKPVRVVGFVMENRDYDGSVDYTDYIKPITWIEERTGFNFMPDLDDDPELRNQLENGPGQLFK